MKAYFKQKEEHHATRMKTVYFILIVASVAFTQSLPSLLNANGTLETYSAQLNTRFTQWGSYYVPNFVAFRNEFVAFFRQDTNVGVLRRNSTGGYDLVSKWPLPETIDPYFYAHLSANDEWIALTNCAYRNGYDYVMALYLLKVADNGTIIDVQTPTIPNGNFTFEASVFHSDGSLIGLSRKSTSKLIKPAAFHRLQLVNGNWTFTHTFPIEEPLEIFTNAFQVIKWQTAVFQLSGNHLVVHDRSKVIVYELSTNATSWTWSIEETGPASGRIDAVAWNGEDTFVVRAATDQSVYLFTRQANGTWSKYAVNLPSGGYVGFAMTAVNKDTFLVSVAQGQGKLGMLQRWKGTWYLAGVFNAIVGQDYAGATLALTDQHILIDGTVTMHAIHVCVFRPIDYDCAQIVELELCDFGNFVAEVACTPKPSLPECIFPVTTVVTRHYIANNTIYIDYEMQRFGAVPRQETVGIRCGLSSAPSTSPNVGTPASSSPSVNSPTSSGPITVGSPSAVPKNADGITSNGCINYIYQIVMSVPLIVLLAC